VALGSHNNTAELVARLCALDGIERAFTTPVFHEAVLLLDRPVAPVLEFLAAQGILGGVDISGFYPELGNALLVCVTENRTPAQLQQYVTAMSEIFSMNEVRDHG
jgi:glycine dehydrogenase subunit 1